MKYCTFTLLLFFICARSFSQDISPLSLRLTLTGGLNLVAVTRYNDVNLIKSNDLNPTDSLLICERAGKHTKTVTQRLTVSDFEKNKFNVNRALPHSARHAKPYFSDYSTQSAEGCDYFDTVSAKAGYKNADYNYLVLDQNGKLKNVIEYLGNMADSVQQRLPVWLRQAAMEDHMAASLKSELTPYKGLTGAAAPPEGFNLSKATFYNYAGKNLVSAFTYCQYLSVVTFDSLTYNTRGQLVGFRRKEGNTGAIYKMSYNCRKKIKRIRCHTYNNDVHLDPASQNMFESYYLRYRKSGIIKRVKRRAGKNTCKIWIRKT